MPWAMSVRRIPIWAKPRADPPPSASPITGRRRAPSPTFPSGWPSKLRFIQLLSNGNLLLGRHHAVLAGDRQSRSLAWFMPDGIGQGGEYDWNATYRLRFGRRWGSASGTGPGSRRLEFAAFSVKSICHDFEGDGG